MKTNSSVKWQEARQIRSKNRDSRCALKEQYRTNSRFAQRSRFRRRCGITQDYRLSCI